MSGARQAALIPSRKERGENLMAGSSRRRSALIHLTLARKAHLLRDCFSGPGDEFWRAARPCLGYGRVASVFRRPGDPPSWWAAWPCFVVWCQWPAQEFGPEQEIW